MNGGYAMKSRRSFVPALAGALAVFVLMADPAAAQLTGHIKSVDATANRLVLTQTGTGTELTVAVPTQTMVVTKAGNALTLKDLRRGDSLAITLVGGIVSRIVAEQGRIVGTVKSSDPDAKRLVIREFVPKGEERTNKDDILTIDDKTTITTTDGKPIKFGELKEGDGVSIAHAGDLAEKIEVNVKPDELTGFVKSVGADLKTFVVTQTGTTKDFTVAITPETVIETTEGKPIKVKELKEGDGVGVAHASGTAQKIVVAVKPLR